MSTRYIVAGARPWIRAVFEDTIARYPGEWVLVEDAAALTPEYVESIGPRYLFFLHWSSRIPERIVRKWECVVFHMTDVPYGRGGSPLQNLILRGHTHTKLTALRAAAEYDAGDVYVKEDLCLEGTAEEIYVRAARQAAAMIRRLLDESPAPAPQSGDVVMFTRRRPEESEIGGLADLSALRDFIRMLDAPGYPRAFLIHRGFRYEFARVALRDGALVADVSITPATKATP